MAEISQNIDFGIWWTYCSESVNFFLIHWHIAQLPLEKFSFSHFPKILANNGENNSKYGFLHLF